MNKGQIIELYSYDDWANKKMLSAVGQLENEEYIQDLSSSFKSIRDTMVHVLGAEKLWLSRWMGEQGGTLLNPNDFPTYSSLADRGNDFRNQLEGFLVSLTEEDLLEQISYKNTQGNTLFFRIVETDATHDQSFIAPSGTSGHYAQAVKEDTTFTGHDLLLFR